MSQRLQACGACHGPAGRTASDGYYPRIAGKPAAYLYQQLLHFREGRRSYAPMSRLLDTLSEAYLHEIADYYAALELPRPPAEPAQAAPEVLARGRRLALEGDAARQLPACAACHGQALGGVMPAMPGLLGLPRNYLAAQLGAWRDGRRRALAPDCMGEIASRLGPEDTNAVTHWLAAQTLPAHSRAAEPLAGPLPLACGGITERAR